MDREAELEDDLKDLFRRVIDLEERLTKFEKHRHYVSTSFMYTGGAVYRPED
jgi:hypothetical protein